jgi:hypothetical protein
LWWVQDWVRGGVSHSRYAGGGIELRYLNVGVVCAKLKWSRGGWGEGGAWDAGVATWFWWSLRSASKVGAGWGRGEKFWLGGVAEGAVSRSLRDFPV